MIDKDIFLQFISNNFSHDQLYIEKFRPELWFVDIDCFPNKPYILAISILDEEIRFSTIDREPVLDFSLYDFIFQENKEAELFIEKIIHEKSFPFHLKQ
ncbi:hypothetical protein [Flavobacterium chilense]|uniref:Uncharacterized protein n=1 Tax=Flavobacterium chilense TaxID=946677 RepID=A0A1M7LI76_9FLAO|nr:hypothetical protein [Flavobacterium chilense]SHM77831.1 hypothetical protein SAMN05444484_109128 [Flavobacterium chilense]